MARMQQTARAPETWFDLSISVVRADQALDGESL